MRSPRLTATLLALLGAAACGGDDDVTPIDARRIDARVIDAPDIDAAVDAAVDAPIDAPPAVGTTVWVYGDIVTNNLGQLGKFTHPQTGAVVPTLVPATGELPSTNFPVPFSIATDSSRVVYVARAAATDPWKLSYAAADGTGVIDVFTAPAGRTISDVSLSPDKTKIAFRADLELASMYDVYVVPAMAGGTPVKVSPDRATNATTLNAQAFLSWSPDSRYLAYGGDFVTDALNEVRVRDTMANTTATVLATASILSTTNPRGLILPPVWGNGGKLFLSANITAANERRIYTAMADGTGFAVLGNTLLTRTDTTMAQASNFALSPDGNTIVFAADGVTATAFELYVMPSTGAAAPTRLTAGTIAAARGVDTFRLMKFNPAGTMVAFGADYGATDDKFQPYVVAIAGGGAPRRLAVLGLDTDAARDVQNMAWTGDGAFVYAIADGGAADNDFEVYALDAAMTDQAVTAIVDPPVSGDAFELATRW